MLVLLDFNASPYLGVFARANDSIALAPPGLPPDVVEELARALDVPLHLTTIGGSNIVGSVLAMNNKGAVVADFVDDEEVAILEGAGLTIARVTGKYNACGNNVLVNDNGALVNPDIGKRALKIIEEALGVPVEQGTIAGLKTVGSGAFATQKGVLCHPKTTEAELDVIERVLGVDANIGTVNHGAPYIGAGLVGNANGCASGRETTGPEMNRIEEALGYL